jgi:hypothetical protein
LEDDLALLKKFAHAGKYCLATRHIQVKKKRDSRKVTILSCAHLPGAAWAVLPPNEHTTGRATLHGGQTGDSRLAELNAQM